MPTARQINGHSQGVQWPLEDDVAKNYTPHDQPASPIMLDVYTNSDYRITNGAAHGIFDHQLAVAKVISITPSPTRTS